MRELQGRIKAEIRREPAVDEADYVTPFVPSPLMLDRVEDDMRTSLSELTAIQQKLSALSGNVGPTGHA